MRKLPICSLPGFQWRRCSRKAFQSTARLTCRIVLIGFLSLGLSSAQAHTPSLVSQSTQTPASPEANSPIGLWHVHAPLSALMSTGASWTRRMFTLRDYRLGEDGQPIPRPVAAIPPEEIRNRFQWIGTLAYALPQWVSPRPATAKTNDLYPPKDWELFAKLVERFAQDVDDFPAYFEVFNEPEAHWKGTDEELARFIITLAKSIKKVHPRTQILGPGFATADVNRLRELAKFGVLGVLDGVVVHAYVSRGAPEDVFISKVDELIQYVSNLPGSPLPIFITEYGWTTERGTWQPPVEERTQAQYVSRSITLLTARPSVVAFVYFCLLYKAKNQGEAGFSLLRSDGSPKPGLLAYRTAVRWLSSVDRRAYRLPISPNVYAYFFSRAHGSLFVGWSLTDNEPLFVPELPDTTRADIYGNDVRSANREPTETGSPQFIHFAERRIARAQVTGALMLARGGRIPAHGGKVFVPTPLDVEQSFVSAPRATPRGWYLMFVKSVSGEWKITPLRVP